MKKQTAYLILSAFFFTLTALGQNQDKITADYKEHQTEVGILRNIRLTNDSKTETITIDIKPNTKKHALLIASTIDKGKLIIELYDPNGKQQGKFTISTQLDSDKKERVRGNISKSLIEPEAGQWKVKIIPTNATGRISLNSAIIE